MYWVRALSPKVRRSTESSVLLLMIYSSKRHSLKLKKEQEKRKEKEKRKREKKKRKEKEKKEKRKHLP
jgi:hypothetical protein